ncbi:MAG: trypsin-like peptidase domain-containing protein [Marmoricola sp.]
MTDDENDPWAAPEQRPEPTRPLSGQPWTSPSGPAQPPPPAAPRQPSAAGPPPAYGPTGYPQPYPQPYPSQYSSRHASQVPDQYHGPMPGPAPMTTTQPPRGRLAGWVWPLIAVISMLLGIGGGLVGGLLVARNDNAAGSGGVLHVQQRTAAPLPADNTSIASVAQKMLPSTVQIIAEYNGQARGATGSGFVFDKQGHIITNNHVVAQADKDNGNIEIVDQNGRHSKAKVIGRSSVYDVAVIESDGAKKLTPAKLGSSQQMRVGETVIAFGSPLGLSSSVTSGIISALDRPVTTGESANDQSYINAVQTDAAINPGNSGGPLVDLQGQVVGMNSAIASIGSTGSTQSGNIGVGFAIPIEQVELTAEQILHTGKAQYPVIGANVKSTPNVDGAEITGVTNGEPAQSAGLKVGDLVTKVDGKPITSSIGLVVAIRSHVKGDKLALTVKRGSDVKKFTITLAARSN